MILGLWITVGILGSLLASSLRYIQLLHRALHIRAQYIYALIGDSHEDLTGQVASARASLGESLQRDDELGLREWLAEEERRAY